MIYFYTVYNINIRRVRQILDLINMTPTQSVVDIYINDLGSIGSPDEPVYTLTYASTIELKEKYDG